MIKKALEYIVGLKEPVISEIHGSKIHNNQVQRRVAKDRALEMEKPAAFFTDKANKPSIGQLKRLLKEQKDREAYLETEREYVRRAGDEG